MAGKEILDLIAKILVIVGGLNWLLVGAFSFDLVQALFGFMPVLVKTVYIIVGICALYMIYLLYEEMGK